VKPHVEQIDQRWEEARSATLDTAHMDNDIQQQSNYGRFQPNSQDMPLPRMVEAMTRQYNNMDDKYGGGLYDDQVDEMSIRNPQTSPMNQSRPNDGVEDNHQDRRTNRSSRQPYGRATDKMLLIIKTSRTSSSMPSRKNKTFQWRS
jgi:hypothetical protein